MPDAATDVSSPAADAADDTSPPPQSWPWRALAGRAAALLGLASLAVTQPLLDLFGRNPEFFVAGRYSSVQIVMFAIVVALVPAAVATVIVGAVTAINRRAGAVAFAVLAGVFGAALVAAILRSNDVDALAIVLVLAVAGGALVAFVVRSRAGSLLASYLALAGVFFTAAFLLFSPTADLVRGQGLGDLGHVDVPVPQGPVVWIVLDEFPIASILGADGEINAERFPGFAELASVSTWYRNASSPHNLTHRAVPAQLTGVVNDGDTLPRYQDHPRNLFTLLGGEIPIERYESVTDMCPPADCEPPPQQALSQALHDAAVVYGHRVLPSAWRDGLPTIDNSWGSFGAEADTGSTSEPSELSGQDLVTEAYSKWRELGADERSPLGQAGILREQIDGIGAAPALHFVHVALPHRPWVLSRSGLSTSFAPELITDPDAPGYEFGVRLDFQLSSMQLGAVDLLVSELVDHLRSLPTWEQTTLVLTSDHGTNLTPPDIGRMKVTDANREEVYRVPLFIKAPGQVDGERSDVSAQTIDILPTLVDMLGGDVDWEFDGHSLVDGSAASVEPNVSADVQPLLDLAARRAEEFPHGADWVALAAVGVNGDLVGADLAELPVGEVSRFRATLDQAELFSDLPTAQGTEPFVIAGTVRGEEAPAEELVVAVNGRIAGVVGGYRPVAGGFAFDGYVADFYRPGANDVKLYEVERSGDEVTLHPVDA